MDSLIYSLNATVPVFLVMVVGYILKRAATDIIGTFEPKYVIFCASVTAVMFFGLWLGARFFIKDKSLIGEFVQASYRSSAAVLGIAFIENIYGTSGMAPVMIIGCVPLFNVFAVIVLTFESESGSDGLTHIKRSLINIAKNPIIISIVLGVIASLLRVNFPEIIDKTLASFAKMASPLALVTIGAGFEGRKAIAKIKPTAVATFIKLIALPAIFLPIGIKLGFRDEALVALIIMLGSPTTPSSYIMSKNMGHDGVLSSSAIVATTLISSVTLTFWIFITRALGYIG